MGIKERIHIEYTKNTHSMMKNNKIKLNKNKSTAKKKTKKRTSKMVERWLVGQRK